MAVFRTIFFFFLQEITHQTDDDATIIALESKLSAKLSISNSYFSFFPFSMWMSSLICEYVPNMCTHDMFMTMNKKTN